jgi:chromosome partitioning protein
VKTLAFFNNKGGVGKTSLAYHMAWMFAELGVNVVAVDLDPQSNLTSSFLDETTLEELWGRETSARTILGAIQPLLERMGDLADPYVFKVHPRIRLVP